MRLRLRLTPSSRKIGRRLDRIRTTTYLPKPASAYVPLKYEFAPLPITRDPRAYTDD